MSGPFIVTERIRAFTVEEIAQLSAPELACILDDLAEQRAALALIEDKVRVALDLKYGARARQRRAEEAKDTGTVRFEDNEFTVIAELPKRVKWDQDKLRHAGEIIRTGWGDDPSRLHQDQARGLGGSLRQLAETSARAVHAGAHG